MFSSPKFVELPTPCLTSLLIDGIITNFLALFSYYTIDLTDLNFSFNALNNFTLGQISNNLKIIKAT